MIDRDRLGALLRRERAAFAAGNPRSAAEYAQAGNLFGRVPTTWMNKKAAVGEGVQRVIDEHRLPWIAHHERTFAEPIDELTGRTGPS
ncbi:hypothetical protein AB0M46_21300 [Dactylosporangium sp. NPDC051485]|uniref:hypothetical protein n=1 Tax=Dactylosporangium sp. NPDC051485 TaxID=3154846 RepID=UPI0034499F99